MCTPPEAGRQELQEEAEHQPQLLGGFKGVFIFFNFFSQLKKAGSLGMGCAGQVGCLPHPPK